MRDASDELAVRNGCWFSWKRASYAVWWIERYCILYEGEDAGEPMRLRGLHSVPLKWAVPRRWDEAAQQQYAERMQVYLDGLEAGERRDWQYEFAMRLFGWARWSDEWQANIRRFRTASSFIAKKCKKSPTAAAIGLYLTIGDGEPGNKVGLCAKDGSQARDIVGKHVIEMVRSSPELMKSCKLNMNEFMVTHIGSKSMMKPLSSSNERNTKAKEGFNGSLIVDEVHVVDRAFMRRMSRAGISRKEPLLIEVSTAGDDPDGYGKERFDFCLDVMSGKSAIDTHLAVVHAADQACDLRAMTDKQIEEAAYAANPALGHTVHLPELLADVKNSSRNVREICDCAMYRFNVWQTSSHPWIPPYQWAGCGADLNIADYRGRYALVGFDFGSTRDFAAFVAGVPEVDETGLKRLDLFPWIIAPRAYVEANKINTPFRDWEDRGLLMVSPGEKIDLGFLFDVFSRIAKIFEVGALVYDPYRAEELTQLIAEGARSPDGEQFMEGFGVPRVPIGANSFVLSTAIEEFHNRVEERVIRHPRHEVLSAMIGNVNLKSVAGRMRIEKPGKDSVRKIDGAMAAVLMFAAATNPQFWPERSIYESRGIRTL